MVDQYLDEGLAISSLQKLGELMEMQKSQITRGGHSEDGEMEGEEVHEKDRIGKDGNYNPPNNLVHKSDGLAPAPSRRSRMDTSVRSMEARESRVPAGKRMGARSSAGREQMQPPTGTIKSQDEAENDIEKSDVSEEIENQDLNLSYDEAGENDIDKSDFGSSSFANTGDRSGVPAYESARSRAPGMQGRQAMKTETPLTRENRGRAMDPSSRTGSEKPAFNRSYDEGEENDIEKGDDSKTFRYPSQMHKPVTPRASKPDNPRGAHSMERQLNPPATTKSIDVQRFLTYLAKSVTDALDDMRENVFIVLNEMNKSRLEMGETIIESLSDIDGVVQKSLGVVDEAEQQPARGPLGVTSDNEALQKSQAPKRRLVHDVQLRKAIAEEMSNKIIAGTASYGLTDLTRFEHNPAEGLPEHIAKSLSCLQG